MKVNNNYKDRCLVRSIVNYCKDQRGSATVMCAGIIVCILVIISIIAGALHLKVEKAKLQSIANIVAISGANEAFYNADGCKEAKDTAAKNGAEVLECKSDIEQANFADYLHLQTSDAELIPKVRLSVKVAWSRPLSPTASAAAKTTDLPCGFSQGNNSIAS